MGDDGIEGGLEILGAVSREEGLQRMRNEVGRGGGKSSNRRKLPAEID